MSNIAEAVLSSFIENIDCPDTLSREFNEKDHPITKFEWSDGRVRELPYEERDYDRT